MNGIAARALAAVMLPAVPRGPYAGGAASPAPGGAGTRVSPGGGAPPLRRALSSGARGDGPLGGRQGGMAQPPRTRCSAQASAHMPATPDSRRRALPSPIAQRRARQPRAAAPRA